MTSDITSTTLAAALLRGNPVPDSDSQNLSLPCVNTASNLQHAEDFSRRNELVQDRLDGDDVAHHRVFIPPREQETPTLRARCSAEIKERFRAVAAAAGLTESVLLRRMAAAAIAQHDPGSAAVPRSDTCGGCGGHGGQLRLRLLPTEIQVIRALAEPEGYSAQAWIVRQLRQRIEGAVPFANAELDALQEAMRELGAVGRNLNTLLHVLHRSGRVENDGLDLQRLSTGIEQLRREVTSTMTRATHRGLRADA